MGASCVPHAAAWHTRQRGGRRGPGRAGPTVPLMRRFAHSATELQWHQSFEILGNSFGRRGGKLTYEHPKANLHLSCWNQLEACKCDPSASYCRHTKTRLVRGPGPDTPNAQGCADHDALCRMQALAAIEHEHGQGISLPSLIASLTCHKHAPAQVEGHNGLQPCSRR